MLILKIRNKEGRSNSFGYSFYQFELEIFDWIAQPFLN